MSEKVKSTPKDRVHNVPMYIIFFPCHHGYQQHTHRVAGGHCEPRLWPSGQRPFMGWVGGFFA